MEQREKIFNEIVGENHGSIYRICLGYLYDKSHADDLYQEILLQIWISLNKYKGGAQVSTWVYRIAINTAITYNVKNKKYQHAELSQEAGIPDDSTDKSRLLEKESQLDRLKEAIHQLEEQDRLIISLVLENLSYKDIAEITGSNVNNIGVRITRIKTRLSKLIER